MVGAMGWPLDEKVASSGAEMRAYVSIAYALTT
jgi:hypothetical protein